MRDFWAFVFATAVVLPVRRYAKGIGVGLTLRVVVLALLVGLCGGCSPAARRNVASAMNGTATAIAPSKLMIFGGEGHSTYLGCLNCTEYATDSLSRTLPSTPS